MSIVQTEVLDVISHVTADSTLAIVTLPINMVIVVVIAVLVAIIVRPATTSRELTVMLLASSSHTSYSVLLPLGKLILITTNMIPLVVEVFRVRTSVSEVKIATEVHI